jgi:site-specific DNA recombinase
VVNHREADRVRNIFDLYLEQQSLLPTIGELDRRGWTTKQWTTKKGKQRGGRAFNKNTLQSLLNLAPDIQEKMLYLPPVERGKDAVIERDLRAIVAVLDWRKQRRIWEEYATECSCLLERIA